MDQSSTLYMCFQYLPVTSSLSFSGSQAMPFRTSAILLVFLSLVMIGLKSWSLTAPVSRLISATEFWQQILARMDPLQNSSSFRFLNALPSNVTLISSKTVKLSFTTKMVLPPSEMNMWVSLLVSPHPSLSHWISLRRVKFLSKTNTLCSLQVRTQMLSLNMVMPSPNTSLGREVSGSLQYWESIQLQMSFLTLDSRQCPHDSKREDGVRKVRPWVQQDMSWLKTSISSTERMEQRAQNSRISLISNIIIEGIKGIPALKLNNYLECIEIKGGEQSKIEQGRVWWDQRVRVNQREMNRYQQQVLIIVMNRREDYYKYQPSNYSFESKNMGSSKKRAYLDLQQSSSRRPKDDAQIIFQYELKREKEKVVVLEERLKNKEIFIVQMKEFQKELSKAFDESQEELKYLKIRCEELEDTDIQSCLLEIQQLKLLLSKSQIHNKQLQQTLKQTIRGSSRERQTSRRSSKKPSPSLQLHQLNTPHPNNPSDSHFTNIFCKPFNNHSREEVIQNGYRLASFMNCFLEMGMTCNPSTVKMPLKDQLKTHWKWVKDIVKSSAKETGDLQQTHSNQYSKDLKRLFHYRSTKEIVPIIEDVLKENKEYKKVIDLIADYFGMGEERELKDVYQCLKRKKKQRRGEGETGNQRGKSSEELK